MKSYPRIDRVSDLIQRTLAELLVKGAQDPRFSQVTITAIDVAPNYSVATVMVMIHTKRSPESILKALNKAAGFFRTQLARQVALKQVPKLTFSLDKTLMQAQRIDQLLDGDA